jgi:2-keto-4-pentenoate hydratase/2-oxohepta-3-ene-1,7-dioic acid hydratase in catechol pathway
MMLTLAVLSFANRRRTKSHPSITLVVVVVVVGVRRRSLSKLKRQQIPYKTPWTREKAMEFISPVERFLPAQRPIQRSSNPRISIQTRSLPNL